MSNLNWLAAEMAEIMKPTQEQISKYLGVSSRTFRRYTKAKQNMAAVDCQHNIDQRIVKLVGLMNKLVYKCNQIHKSGFTHVAMQSEFYSCYVNGKILSENQLINAENLTLTCKKLYEVVYD